jgi:hypothetical protein
VAAARSRAAPRKSATQAASGSEREIDSFLAKYTPQMAATARDARARMRRRIAGGVEFVYDNYNALVFGFGPTEKPSEAVLSLAIFPEWVTLCFLKGAKLSDPKKLLKGGGNIVRNVRLHSAGHLEDPDIERLVSAAIAAAFPAYPQSTREPTTLIKSISTKQRPRRPAKPSPRSRRSSK